MKDSQTTKDALESLQFLRPEEREELDMLLATVAEPMTIIRQVIRPDRSVAGYLLMTKDGPPIELDPNDPLLAGFPPITPEVNGGYRPGGRQ